MKLLKSLLLILAVALMTATTPAQTPGAAKAPAQTKTAAPAAALVDINSASAADLKAIPGIGDAYSAKIIAGRPYANKSQLVSKKIISQSLYDKIQDKIIAKQK